VNIEKEISTKKQRLEKIKKKEAELTENLDGELIFKFERIIRKKKGRGIVGVRGKEHPVCQSCRMILPVQFAVSVRTSNEVLACPYCSSILFYEEAEEEDEEFFDSDDSGALSEFDESDEELIEDDEEEPVDDDKVNIDYED